VVFHNFFDITVENTWGKGEKAKREMGAIGPMGILKWPMFAPN
jgi:hypothetical protein